MSLLSGSDISGIQESLSQAGVFGDLCTIQESVSTTSASGGKITTWKDFTGHTNIPCIISQQQIMKKQSSGLPLTYTSIRVRLNAFYPSIKIGHHAVIGSDIWEVIDLIIDSQKIFSVMEVQRWKV